MIELILWGIVTIGVVGFSCCVVSLILDRRLWKLKTELWLEEYRLRQLAMTCFINPLGLKKPVDDNSNISEE
jgi:hypothetical protein